MAKSPKPPAQYDVAILGQHPCAYFAASLLHSAGHKVVHLAVPDAPLPARHTLFSPELFSLHKILASLQKRLDLTTAFGLRFLAQDPATSAEFRSKSTTQYSVASRAAAKAFAEATKEAGVPLLAPKSLAVTSVDEKGVTLRADAATIAARLLIVALPLDAASSRTLGIPATWDRSVRAHVAWTRVKPRSVEWSPRPVVPISLDVMGTLSLGWLIPTPDAGAELAVEIPHDEDAARALPRLQRWAQTLHAHGHLKSPSVDAASVESAAVAPAGALSVEGVASRTLLIGPAGGFSSATGDELYPACWSAIFAVEVATAALAAPHPQDALAPFRSNWRTTLGQYLRGPRENLRFLLPLVYRNPAMTTRMAEAILQGTPVVR